MNCEQKKSAPYLITIGRSIGFICKECYNAYVWASKSDGKKSVSIQKIDQEYSPYLIQKDI